MGLLPESIRKTRTPGELLEQRRSLAIYIAKCAVGAAIILSAAPLFDYKDPFWCLISLILVLTPDSRQAMPLAITRLKANICGAAIAFLCMALALPHLPGLVLAFAATAALCFLWDVMDGSRSAMAAALIVMQREPGTHLWTGAVERVAAVFAGCLLGVIVTLAFDLVFERRRKKA